ncbi:Protein of unknown function DUF4504, partial [Trinorchestia longiramus]
MSTDVIAMWKKTFTEVLGKESVEFSEELLLLMLAVDESVKPSFLWDYPSVLPKDLLILLQILHSKSLVKTPLAVVYLDEDIFVVNLDALTRVLISYITSDHTWLIDISKAEPRVAAPCVHEAFKGYICTILQQLGIVSHRNTTRPPSPDADQQQSQSNDARNSLENEQLPTKNDQCQLLSINLPEATNLSSVFGVLLGYPQVYWWDSQSDGSNLSGIPLKVYKFTAVCRSLSQQEENEKTEEEEEEE